MASSVLIYSTFENYEQARSVSKHLLEMRLVGCSVMLPAQSMYWWKGAITQSSEVVLLLKTTKSLAVKAKKELSKKHSYAVPCILDWPVGVNDSYLNWLMESTKKTKKRKKR